MVINWHGKPGWKNRGHEIEYGQSAETISREIAGSVHNLPRYYFSLCGQCGRSKTCEHCKDNPEFHVFIYREYEGGWMHVCEAPTHEQARELANAWEIPAEALA